MKTDQLWGGVLKDVRLVFPENQLVAIVDVLDGGVKSRHELLFGEVSEIRYSNNIEGPWEYAELTEVHASFEDGIWRVEFVLWTDDTGMTINCSHIYIDGVCLEPE